MECGIYAIALASFSVFLRCFRTATAAMTTTTVAMAPRTRVGEGFCELNGVVMIVEVSEVTTVEVMFGDG
jgi:hypothetical protein